MLSRNKNNSAACAVTLAVSLLFATAGSPLAAKSVISTSYLVAASQTRRASNTSLAPVNTAAFGPADPAVPVIQAPEPPSSIVSAIGFLYLCAGLAFFKRRKRSAHMARERNGATNFDR